MSASANQVGHYIRNLWELVFGEAATSTLQRRLARGAIGSFGMKVASTGLGFVTTILLARFLNTTDYGLFAYATAWIALLTVPGVFGFDRLLVREVAYYQAKQSWRLARGLMQRAGQLVVVGSSLMAMGVALILWLGGNTAPERLSVLMLALVLLPLASLTRVRQAALQGLNHVIAGQLPELLIRPILFIVLFAGCYLVLGSSINAQWAIGSMILASLISFMVGADLLRRRLPRPIVEAAPEYQGWAWMWTALPMLFFGGMSVLNAQIGTIMLGLLANVEAVAIYSVAAKTAALIAFTLGAVNTALAPNAARLSASGDMEQLQRIVTKTARAILVTALPIALFFMIFGRWFLLIFGAEFTQAAWVLVILSCGQLVNASMGSVGLLLNMTRHERDAAISVALSALLNVVLNLLLIPRLGAEGAALAATGSLALWNIGLAIWVYYRIGINPTAFGWKALRKRQ
jgi:O-antigen/teichoic acid export membrane protein